MDAISHLQASRSTRGVATLLTAVLLVASSCGTTATRAASGPLGAYPMSAIAFDFVYMSRAFGPGEEMSGAYVGGPFYVIVGLVSLPLDCTFDVILLPFDIVAWIAGRKRSWPSD